MLVYKYQSQAEALSVYNQVVPYAVALAKVGLDLEGGKDTQGYYVVKAGVKVRWSAPFMFNNEWYSFSFKEHYKSGIHLLEERIRNLIGRDIEEIELAVTGG